MDQLLCELHVYATVPPVVFEIRDVLTRGSVALLLLGSLSQL